MRGYLQRLVESRETRAPSASVPIRSVLPSRSPIAETDQRLQVASLADGLGAFAPETAMPEAAPIDESRTIPADRTARSAPSPARTAGSSLMPQPVVQRYAMPAPASAPAPTHAAPAAPTTPIVDEPRPLRSASLEAPATPLPPIATEAPEPRILAEAPQPAKLLPARGERVPANEVHVPPPRNAREIELTDAEPVRAPPAPQQTIVVRETIRTPTEAPQKPQRAPQKLPRTAGEASVIGPLPRPEQTRARLELCLR